MNRFAFLTVIGYCIAVKLSVAAGAVLVDISENNGRRDHLIQQGDNWPVKSGELASFTSRGVEFELRKAGELDGAGLQTFFDKAALVRGARLAADGVFVSGDGAGLEMTIRGLSPGRHSLVTYHNVNGNTRPQPIDVTATGCSGVVGVHPSQDANDDDVAFAYIEFEAPLTGEALVDLRIAAGSGDASRVVLNGFELDAVDPAKRARKPEPAWGDEHVAENPVLSWRAAKGATGHDVYLGTDRDAVTAASTKSPEYRGRQTEAKLAAEADDPFVTYYWRVDEVRAGSTDRGDKPRGPREEVRGDKPRGSQEEIAKGDVWSFRVRRLAFPGAEGYGRFAAGGRGGRVYKVTTLADAGPGSLREAVEALGPRTVVFDISGRIELQSKLVVRNPYLTIAGQTAPGKGICISNYNLGMMGAHDVIVRYMRVRPGNTAGVTLDGMGMASSDHAIIDHCSISWTQDEAFSSRGAKNITLQRSLISEALNIAGHKKYEKGKQHGYAASIGGDIGSFHHNLLAHCAGRNWSLAGGLDQATRHTGRLDIRNNVVYNWGHRTTDGGAAQVNFVNNYYKPGPASRVFHVLMPELEAVDAFGPQRYFVSGNVMEGRYGADDPLAGVREPLGLPKNMWLVEQPFFQSHVETQSAEHAFENMLADVGCNRPALDEHDQRVIGEVRAGKTTYKGSVSGLPGLPDSQDDVGGWEDYPEEHRPADWDADGDGMPGAWEAQRGLNPNSPAGDFNEANGDADGDGWTNLEEYLNEAAAPRA
jgi:hypothetical protein